MGHLTLRDREIGMLYVVKFRPLFDPFNRKINTFSLTTRRAMYSESTLKLFYEVEMYSKSIIYPKFTL